MNRISRSQGFELVFMSHYLFMLTHISQTHIKYNLDEKLKDIAGAMCHT